MSAVAPRVDVVIVSYETRDLTLEAVRSVLGQTGVDVRVIVVDNASSDGSADAIEAAVPEATVIRSGANLGFGRGVNLGVAASDAPWILLLNSDARLTAPNAVVRLVAELEADPEAALLGPRVVQADGRVQHTIGAFPGALRELVRGFSLHGLLDRETRARLLGSEFQDYDRPARVPWVVGACVLVRRKALDDVGGFDPAIFMYGEEVELAMRLRAHGWFARFTPDVEVHHARGASSPRAWQRLAAMAGDAWVVRKHRGPLRFLGFAVARTAGLAVQGILQTVLGALGGNADRRALGAERRAEFRAWLRAWSGGASTRPGHPRFLPPGATPP